jgi:hypothetical protein
LSEVAFSVSRKGCFMGGPKLVVGACYAAEEGNADMCGYEEL